MYSVVVMMALSGSVDLTPDFCKGRRCHGCYGCYGCCGYNYGCCGCHGPSPVVYGRGQEAPAEPVKGEEKGKKLKKMPQKEEKLGYGGSQEPAVIQVSLPADAQVTIDGNPTFSTSAERTFVSPPLPVGSNFTYTIRAEIVRNGRKEAQNKEVIVRGGEETQVRFIFASGVVASNR